MSGENFHDVRRQFEKLAHSKTINTGYDWPVFRTDAAEYLKDVGGEGGPNFAEDFPDAEQSLREDFKKRHERGEQVLVFDICGAADASSLGADHTVCLSFRPPPPLDNVQATRTILEGDIFRKDSITALRESSEKYGARPCCMFFVPVGGFHGLDIPNAMKGAILVKQFKALYELLSPGGFMYIQVPTQVGLTIGADWRPISPGEVLREIVADSGVVEYRYEHSSLFRVRKNEEEKVAK